MSKARQLKLPMQPGCQHNAVNLPEWSVQKTIEEGLSYLGYIVLHTQHQYMMQTCPTCGAQFRATGGYGADKAIPDLLVRGKSWPVGCLLGIEVKGTRTPLSEEQKLLAADGGLVVCRSWEDAEAAIRAFEEAIRRPYEEPADR